MQQIIIIKELEPRYCYYGVKVNDAKVATRRDYGYSSGHIEPFEMESDDWELYTERLDQFLLANGIDDDKKKVAVFVTVIGQKAYAVTKPSGTYEAP